MESRLPSLWSYLPTCFAGQARSISLHSCYLRNSDAGQIYISSKKQEELATEVPGFIKQDIAEVDTTIAIS